MKHIINRTSGSILSYAGKVGKEIFEKIQSQQNENT